MAHHDEIILQPAIAVAVRSESPLLALNKRGKKMLSDDVFADRRGWSGIEVAHNDQFAVRVLV